MNAKTLMDAQQIICTVTLDTELLTLIIGLAGKVRAMGLIRSLQWLCSKDEGFAKKVSSYLVDDANKSVTDQLEAMSRLDFFRAQRRALELSEALHLLAQAHKKESSR